jgi:hypothetical protein
MKNLRTLAKYQKLEIMKSMMKIFSKQVESQEVNMKVLFKLKKLQTPAANNQKIKKMKSMLKILSEQVDSPEVNKKVP